MRFLYVLLGALLGVILGLYFGGAPIYHIKDIVWLEAPRYSMPWMDGMICYYREPQRHE